jgi:hypothetical protein
MTRSHVRPDFGNETTTPNTGNLGNLLPAIMIYRVEAGSFDSSDSSGSEPVLAADHIA